MFRDRRWQCRSVESWIGVALLLLLIVLPIVWIVGYSAAYSVGGIGRFSAGWTLDHWKSGFKTGGLTQSFAFSIAVAGATVALAMTCSLAFTIVAADVRHDRRLLALLCVPMGTPVAVVAVMTWQMLSPGGLLARLAWSVGWIEMPADFPVLVNDAWAVGIVVAGVATSFPLLSLYFLSTWTTARIDRYCRLAESLGAGRWRTRLTVALPMLVRRSGSMALLMFLLSLGSYEIPLLLGRQSPQMISMLIQRNTGQFNLTQRPQAFVMATTYLLLLSTGVVLIQRRSR